MHDQIVGLIRKQVAGEARDELVECIDHIIKLAPAPKDAIDDIRMSEGTSGLMLSDMYLDGLIGFLTEPVDYD